MNIERQGMHEFIRNRLSIGQLQAINNQYLTLVAAGHALCCDEAIEDGHQSGIIHIMHYRTCKACEEVTMASKYKSLRGKIPAAVQEQKYQDRVNEMKSTLAGEAPGGLNVSALASMFVARKMHKDKLEEQIKYENLAMEAMSQMLVEQLEGEQMQTVSLSSGATVFLKDSVYPSVEDEKSFNEWIDSNNMQDIRSVNARRLQGIVGEMLTTGKSAPPGVKVFLKTYASVRFPGKKQGEENEEQ